MAADGTVVQAWPGQRPGAWPLPGCGAEGAPLDVLVPAPPGRAWTSILAASAEACSLSAGEAAVDLGPLPDGGAVVVVRPRAGGLEALIAQYRAFFEGCPDPILIFTPDGRILDANPATVLLMGKSAAELRRCHAWDMAPALAREDARQIWSSFSAARGPARGEIVVERDDGTQVELEVLGQYVEIGGRGMIVSAGRDVTARRQAEAAAERSRRHGLHRQKMEALGRLAGGVAHDFNNLLTVITFAAEELIEQLGEGHPLRHDASQIADAAARAGALTRQLLAFSHTRASDPVIVDLSVAFAELRPMLERVIGEEYELVSDLAPAPLPVLGEVERLGQVVVNLVVNARDAMPGGGTITVSTERRGLAQGQHPDLPPGEYAALAVRDRGAGISPDVLPRVFEPFFTTKELGKGTGLGLSTVYGIAQELRGAVSVAETSRRGTTLEVLLPLRAGVPSCEPLRLRQPASAASGEGRTVLLVEDQADLRAAARATLEGAAYQVVAASNAGEALLLAERRDGDIDLLLTDVVMPVVSGPELAESFARLQPGTPVLYMSGYADHEALQAAGGPNGIALLRKPFGPEQLLAAVGAALAGPAPVAAATARHDPCDELGPPVVVDTSTARTWLADDGVVRHELPPGARVALDDARRYVDAVREVAGGVPRPAVIDMRGLVSATREARAHFAGPEAAAGATALAMVLDRSVGGFIGSVYLALHRPPVPTRIFYALEPAIAWARRHLDADHPAE